MSGSTPDETFRETMQGCNPDGEPTTVIVTRQGLGSAGRVWLTFNGAIKTTVVMTNPETAQLRELLNDAMMARQGKTGALHDRRSPAGASRTREDGQ